MFLHKRVKKLLVPRAERQELTSQMLQGVHQRIRIRKAIKFVTVTLHKKTL